MGAIFIKTNMADKKRPRLSRLSPGSKLLAKERRKGTLREYQQSRHVVRLSDDTWNEWNRLKKELNVNTHDEFAVRLLQAWAVTGQIPEEKESEEERSGLISERTPIKSKTEGHVVHSTPANLEVAGPSFPVSDISESNGGSETDKSEDSVVTRYLEKARKTDKSFLEYIKSCCYFSIILIIIFIIRIISTIFFTIIIVIIIKREQDILPVLL